MPRAGDPLDLLRRSRAQVVGDGDERVDQLELEPFGEGALAPWRSPVTGQVTTAFGAKVLAPLAPGRAVSAAFSTRAASLQTGTVSTTLRTDSGAEVTLASPFAATTCG